MDLWPFFAAPFLVAGTAVLAWFMMAYDDEPDDQHQNPDHWGRS